MKKTISQKDKTELKLDILEFAQINNLEIHPDKDLDGFCERTISVGHCICRNEELYCPCEQALPLCLKQGYCTCRLFVNQGAYPVELAKARDRWRKKNEQNKSVCSDPLRAMQGSQRASRKRTFLSQRSRGTSGAG